LKKLAIICMVVSAPSWGFSVTNVALSSSASMSPESLRAAFLCIHSHEAPWDDPNPPYYGGLQMDAEFERMYGPEFVRSWGHANNWPAEVQLVVGYRAYFSGRGFHPWPNTARACGLI